MKAWQVLEEKEWHQGGLAKTKEGMPVSPRNPYAFYLCAVGALEYCYVGEAYFEAYRKLKAAVGGVMVSKWNDDRDRTKADVIAKMKEADV